MFQRVLLVICIIISNLTLIAQAQPRGQVEITPQNPIIQPGGSIALNATGATFYMWSPAQGLSDTIGSTTMASPTQTTRYTCKGFEPGEEKVVNGGFEQGNFGFTSGYIYNDSLWAEGTYNVGSSAVTYHPNFQGSPHDGNNFMIVNGATVPGTNVWTEQIQVRPNTFYAFSTWVCTACDVANVAKLQFSINGAQIGRVFRAPNAIGVWNMFYQIWYSGNNTNATITILNQNTAGGGNDFGLDDISFRELVYDSQAQCTVTVDAMTALDDNASTCAGTPVEIDFLHNDHIISGCTNMTCSIIDQASHGLASYQNNVMTYTPDDDYDGVDVFRYRIACGSQMDDATVRVTVHPKKVSDIDAIGCNSYPSPWCDSVYTQSGTYSHHYLTSFGCDSLVRLHLTITTSETYNEMDSTCVFPYYWKSHGYDLDTIYDYGDYSQDVEIGDCYATFNLELNPMSDTEPRYFVEEACDSFFWQDSLFTESTYYMMPVPQASGCDSIYVLDLTLDYSPSLSEILPRDTVMPHYVIPASEFFVMETYYSLQGLPDDVDSVSWACEAANWGLTPSEDGLSCVLNVLNYVPDTVWLTARVYNGCAPDGVERRFWLLCSFFGTGEDLSQEVQVYPNPTDSKLTVQGDELRKVAVYDIYGQMLACYDNLSTNIQSIDLERFAPALYCVEVTTSRGKTIKKVVVQR